MITKKKYTKFKLKSENLLEESILVEMENLYNMYLNGVFTAQELFNKLTSIKEEAYGN